MSVQNLLIRNQGIGQCQLTKQQSVELFPFSKSHPSYHESNKALQQYQLDETKTIGKLRKAILADNLNYIAYYNLSVILVRSGNFKEAYLNLCCALSIAYLLRGKKHKNVDDLEKSIEFSFNNKEARFLKGIFKYIEQKYVEALNQLNYAAYLDPGNEEIKILLEKVQKKLNIRQLKGKSSNKMPKFNRLETSKEIDDVSDCNKEIDQLIKQFSNVLKYIGQGLEVIQVNQIHNQQIETIVVEKQKISLSKKQTENFSTLNNTKTESELPKSKNTEKQESQFSFEVKSFEDSSQVNLSFPSIESIPKPNSNEHFIDLSSLTLKNFLDQSSELDILKSISEDQPSVKLPQELIEKLKGNEKITIGITKQQCRQEYEIIDVEGQYKLIKIDTIRK